MMSLTNRSHFEAPSFVVHWLAYAVFIGHLVVFYYSIYSCPLIHSSTNINLIIKVTSGCNKLVLHYFNCRSLYSFWVQIVHGSVDAQCTERFKCSKLKKERRTTFICLSPFTQKLFWKKIYIKVIQTSSLSLLPCSHLSVGIGAISFQLFVSGL